MPQNSVDKILVVAANPLNTTRLRLDKEVQEISDALRRSRQRDKFLLEQHWATRARDLRSALLYSPPRILHFSGHGETDGLFFENESGAAQQVSPQALTNLFELFADEIECVLLNACSSAPQAKAISRHIKYVIGMSEEIGNQAAIEFATGFYEALGGGRSIEDAYRFGCNAIETEGIPEELTPRLFVRPERANSGAPTKLTDPSKDTGSGAKNSAVEIFYSYSQRDERLRDELETHLSLLRREGLVSSWHNRRITAAKEWEGEIDSHLNEAQVIMLLVSAHFLASDYINDVEVKRAMERHERGEARVIPVILRPCDWETSPFAKLRALPRDDKPVTKWASRDEAFTDIARGVRAVVKELIA
jgi:hypothetical protein